MSMSPTSGWSSATRLPPPHTHTLTRPPTAARAAKTANPHARRSASSGQGGAAPDEWLSPRAHEERCDDPPESAPLPAWDVPLPWVEEPSVGPDSSLDGDRAPPRPPSSPPPPSRPEPLRMMPRHSRCTCVAWCGADMAERLTPPLLPVMLAPPLLRLPQSLLELPPLPDPAPAPRREPPPSGRKKLPLVLAAGLKCWERWSPVRRCSSRCRPWALSAAASTVSDEALDATRSASSRMLSSSIAPKPELLLLRFPRPALDGDSMLSLLAERPDASRLLSSHHVLSMVPPCTTSSALRFIRACRKQGHYFLFERSIKRNNK